MMTKKARFCPNCGSATKRHRRELHKEGEEERSEIKRAVWAMACLFVGGVAAVLLPGGDDIYVNWWQDIGMVVVSLLAVGILGWDQLSKCFANAPKAKDVGLGLLTGLATLAFSIFYVWLLPDLGGGDEEAAEITLALVISVVILAPLLEEWIDRGVAWQAASRIGGPRFTIVVTALLFALAHGLNGWFVLEMPHRFVSGLAYGWLRLRSGSLVPCIAAHMIHNGLATWLA